METIMMSKEELVEKNLDLLNENALLKSEMARIRLEGERKELKIAGKEIKDECQYCGEILQCELFRQGHGIRQERSNIADMVQCQINHKEKRTENGKE